MTRLEAFRQAKNWTYEQLGERLGRTGVQCQRYCKAVSQPRPPVAEQIRALSHGVIHLGNYAEPVSDDQASAMMAEIERLAAAASQATAPGKSKKAASA
ncbi:MAG: hypothetical protein CMF01_12980 [Hyphomonas sp.]|uniref:helix-turn-helix domain-containing protein n=1 Tax=Hyphomonas sp. TaxID=87 RepID=UPI000C473FFC|nr:helix-turn-helix transcriptional regulator [Hyphomonas sp.]MBB40990.1 hypothetical protein [Hyphomonas sp.]|tara:strand:- start:744 stop:1040 length:297 start_codon:yes stop_codon:yes gene_type:complete